MLDGASEAEREAAKRQAVMADARQQVRARHTTLRIDDVLAPSAS